MKKKKIKKRHKMFPVIGKYEDTPTNSTFKVTYFYGDVGSYQLVFGDLPPVTLKGCRFQILVSELKRKKKFYGFIKPLLEGFSDWKEFNYQQPSLPEIPLLFGLLKLRKGKKRLFVLLRSVDAYFRSRVINITGCEIDNLLYLDFVNRLKEKP